MHVPDDITSCEELQCQISFEVLEAVSQLVETSINSDLPHSQRMRAIIGCFVHLSFNHTAVMSTYAEGNQRVAPARVRKMAQLERRICDALAKFYREGVTKGHFRDLDPAVAASSILGMCLGMTNWYRPDGRFTEQKVVEQFNLMLSQGFQLTK